MYTDAPTFMNDPSWLWKYLYYETKATFTQTQSSRIEQTFLHMKLTLHVNLFDDLTSTYSTMLLLIHKGDDFICFGYPKIKYTKNKYIENAAFWGWPIGFRAFSCGGRSAGIGQRLCHCGTAFFLFPKVPKVLKAWACRLPSGASPLSLCLRAQEPHTWGTMGNMF